MYPVAPAVASNHRLKKQTGRDVTSICKQKQKNMLGEVEM